MTKQEKPERVDNLMMRMADTVGVDLGDALLEGRLSAAELGQAAVRCSQCEAADTCGGWMDEQAAANPDAAPGYCSNAKLFERLRD